MAQRLVKSFRNREIWAQLNAHPSLSTTTEAVKIRNPFLPHKNTTTGRWAPPKYSLRRQADLVKSARKSQLVHLLPPGPKLPLKELAEAVAAAPKSTTPKLVDAKANKKNVWLQQVVWEGEVKEKKVPGADIGNRLYAGKWRMFKGHKWERTREARLKRRQYLLKGMKSRIERFKSVRVYICTAFRGPC